MLQNKFNLSESKLDRIITESVNKVVSEKNVGFPTLNEIYSNTFNFSKPIPLTETNAKRMLDRHSQNGYAIISACRGGSDFGLDASNPQQKEKLAVINKKRTQELLDCIRQSGFSYTPSYGGFIENQGTENEEEVFERSFIVYANKKNGETDVQGLKEFAVQMCNKFNQDSVLFKAPDEPAKYLDKNADVDMEFGDDVAFNDTAQAYFTDLHKNTARKIEKGRKPTRFTFVESYIAATPQCYSERHLRHLKGEVFVD